MSILVRAAAVVLALIFISSVFPVQSAGQQKPLKTLDKTKPPEVQQKSEDNKELSVEEIRSLLRAISPYLPESEITTKIDLFGSTSMDAMAHNWSAAFKRFHPKASVVISAHGTESVFERLAKNPGSIGMMSRPVSKADLDRLKSLGLKQPIAIQVAREALGVYVNDKNPLTVITYAQLVQLYCKDPQRNEVTWGTVGVNEELQSKPIRRLGRTQTSGTRTFIEKYLFHNYEVNGYSGEFKSNSELVSAVGKDLQAIAIGEFKSSAPGVRRLKLRDDNKVIEGSDHEILLGRYPITRPMTLVYDQGNQDSLKANTEFIRLVLAREGQTKAILAGFFPYDPPTLRAQLAKLNPKSDRR